MALKKDRVYVGTSGWAYRHWVGKFYPPALRVADRLAFYQSHFNSLEINATFYHMPTPAMVKSWEKSFPAGYHLVLKAPRSITHFKKLAADSVRLVKMFFLRTARMPSLKVVLWQLPPFLKKDTGRLEVFLKSLPDKPRQAFEFRHESWWDAGVAALLKKFHCAFASISHPQLPGELMDTTDFLYLRFHGLGPEKYLYGYKRRELAVWARKVKPLLPKKECYAFFNNDRGGDAVYNAQLFRDMLKGA